ncbi:MAG TPA: helix-turn-helix transcriptional regulator [Ktedonobacteraceae bacterium]|nr:helix-turn-helix transcriptional regulator [Ktedonobacteraceae bacterium]
MYRLKVREIAEMKGMSMSKLQRDADIAFRTVKLIYRDPYRDINLSTLDKLAQALGVNICDLIDETSGEQNNGKADHF